MAMEPSITMSSLLPLCIWIEWIEKNIFILLSSTLTKITAGMYKYKLTLLFISISILRRHEEILLIFEKESDMESEDVTCLILEFSTLFILIIIIILLLLVKFYWSHAHAASLRLKSWSKFSVNTAWTMEKTLWKSFLKLITTM